MDHGLSVYWREIESRSTNVQEREYRYALLAEVYAKQTPPHFERPDLELIMRWKHTDARWAKRALDGLSKVDDTEIRTTTSRAADVTDPRLALDVFRRFAKGIGVASVSAILAAARPDRYPVVDRYALDALLTYERPSWHHLVKFDKQGIPIADETIYPPFVEACRELAKKACDCTGETGWTPRRIDMALWGLGKELEERRESLGRGGTAG